MRMHFAPIFLVKILLCLQFLCLCNGAPPKKEDGEMGFRHGFRYTDEEIAFILNELQNFPSDNMKSFDKTIARELSKKINELWRARIEGFPQERTADALRVYLSKKLKTNKQFMAALPEKMRQKLCELDSGKQHGGSRPYTLQEDQFIIDTLLSRPFRNCRISLRIWTDLAEEIRLKKGSQGFCDERTAEGLRRHFHDTLLRGAGRVQVPETLLRKLGFDEGSSSQTVPQCQQTELQISNEDDDELEFWIQELKNAPVELDFSMLDSPDHE